METTETPESTDAGLLESDEGIEVVEVAPPVVAVVVTHDPGAELDEALTSLAGQDYPALSVLVLDCGSAADPTPRIATAMPKAYVRRLDVDQGFATAANEALAVVEGAVFLVFCRDTVALDADAIRVMVEEAYRSNAGIVGPKLVDHDRPDVLVEVGMTVDHYGVPFSGIEPGEFDQEQHDAVRDVFYVSRAAMLVRADLFHELSGFDAATSPRSEDIDLCWRARLAGARVIVAPGSRVRRRRTPPCRDVRAETRGRIRMLCKTYSAVTLCWVLPTALALAIAESVVLTVTGRVGLARALLGGWFDPFRHAGELRRARANTQRLRTVDDGDVRDLMIRGSARLRAFIVQRLHAGDRIAEVSQRTRLRMSDAGARLRRLPAVLAVVLATLLMFGSRSLVFGSIAEVGSFRAWPGIGSLWATFSSSWRFTMMGAARPATPAFGVMAALGSLLLGHVALARSLVIAGVLPLGALGAYRVVRPLASPRLPAVAAAAAYAANPLARNAIAQGELGPLVCYALAPFVLGALMRASNSAAPRGTRAHAVVTVGLLGAIVASVWPPAIGLAMFFALAALVAVPFVGDGAAAGRAAVVAGAGTILGVLLLLPWLSSLVGADAATLGLLPREPTRLVDVLRFQTGPAGAGVAAFGLLAAAALPLAIARGDRLVWTARAWVLVAGSYALTWLPGRLAPSAAVPAPEGTLVGAALGLALATGLGVAAFTDELTRMHFGWRQLLAVIAAVGLALSILGLAADTRSGSWRLEHDDWAHTFAWMDDRTSVGGFRVLWLGDPTVLPVSAKVVDGVGYALTRDGPGDVRALWAAPEEPADRVLADAIVLARNGDTARLGHLLAPAGVRFVALVTRAAPDHGRRGRSDAVLAAALAGQLDLSLSHVEHSGIVYENEAWMARRALVTSGAAGVPVRDASTSALRYEGGAARPVGKTVDRAGTLLWAEAADPGWHARLDGQRVERHEAFGWTNGFDVPGPGRVAIHHDAAPWTRLVLWLQVVAWPGVVALWWLTRRRLATSGETRS